MSEPRPRHWHSRGATAAWLALLLGCIALQYPARLGYAALGLGAWLGALAAFDRGSLERIWHPQFIAISGLFALLSGLLLGTPDARVLGIRISSEGLTAGGLMFIRGLLVIGVSVWAARRVVAGMAGSTRSVHSATLSAAADVAMGLMPELTTRVRERWSRQSRRRGRGLGAVEQTAVELVFQVACVAEGLARPGRSGSAPAVVRVAVVGASGSGKTSTVRLLGRALAQEGLRVEGILQPAQRSGPLAVAYELEDVATGERRAFARRDSPRPESTPVFDPGGWEWSAARLRRARQWGDVVVLDELGLIEGTGQGHVSGLLDEVPVEQATVWLLAVRDTVTDLVRERVGGFEFVLSPTADPAVIRAQIIEILNARRRVLTAAASV